MNQYKLCDVKIVCETILGKTISNRTWIRWKQQVGVNIEKRLKVVDYEVLGRFITLANLKRKKPYTTFKLGEIITAKNLILDEYYESKINYQKFLIPENCKGVELPTIIKLVTGREMSLRSLYRLGKKANIRYQLNNNYSKNEIIELISKIS